MSQPNVIIFFTDQQRHDSTGIHGNPLDLTPNFDRMAQRGTHLHNSFTCQPVCGPARACLQTGTHASTNGCHTNGYALPDEPVGMAHLFQGAGYRTGYIGKWHLGGGDNPKGPVAMERRGGYQYWLAANTLEFTSDAYHTRVYDNDQREHNLPGYRVDALTDAGVRFIDQHQRDQPDQPFFLMMSYLEPHHQNHEDDYPAPEGYRKRYQGRWTPPDLAALPAWKSDNPDTPEQSDRRRVGGSAQQNLGGYWGMVKRLDEALGRLFDSLKSMGLDKDTIVLFSADHACHFKTRNGEYKRSCHESSIRVPTAITGPGFDGGGRVNSLFSLVDIAPTLLDAAGIDVPESMEGHALGRLLRREVRPVQSGPEEKTDQAANESAKSDHEPGWPDDMFVQISEACVGRAIRTQRWKYAVTASQEDAWSGGSNRYAETHLFDLECDPYELNNLVHSKAHAEVRQVMRGRLLKRMAAINEVEPEIVEAEEKGSGQRRVTPADAWS